MIISTENMKNDNEYFESSPIYFLTGNLELSKLFSILCGTQVSFGTYIEKELKDFIVEKSKNVLYCNFFKYKNIKKGIFINKDKPKIAKKIPDLIILNSDKKIITNAELKIRADRSDGKRIPADIQGNKKIKKELKKIFPEYKIENILVSLFKPQGNGNIDVWKKFGANVIYGETFLKNYFNLKFTDFENRLTKNREINNKTLLKLINNVKNATQDKILNKDFLNKISTPLTKLGV